MRLSIVPKLIRFVFVSVAVNLLFFTAMRIVFWYIFNDPNDSIPTPFLLKSLHIGFKFDLRLALLIHAPLMMLAWLKPIDIFTTRLGKRIWSGYLSVINFIVFLIYFFDLGYYGYLEDRIDATILSFLYNPLISLQMLLESYAIFWLLVAFALLMLGYTWLIRHFMVTIGHGAAVADNRWKKSAVISLAVVFHLLGIYGKLSYYPLRWSDAFYSNHSFASALALNPVLYFLSSFKNRAVTYDVDQTRSHYDEIAAYLGVAHPDKKELSYIRCSSGAAEGSRRPNVVIVLLESFAYYKTSVSGNPLDPTPFFKDIAEDSLLFSRFYVPHGGTARSVFTLLTGIPDVEPINTSSRNPLVVRQHTIVNAFTGYEKFYFLGGSLNWAEIRGLLSHNIPGLHIYEEGSYSSPRVDTWGISDLDLMQEAHKVLRDVKDAPFFAIIHTAGNHRPYTIPENSLGFECRSLPEDEAVNYGFESIAGYNSIRFMDHSIKLFLEAARQEPYFDNTIFVFLGDHGSGRRHPVHMPKAEDQLGLTIFHVPLVIYAPGLISEGKSYDTVASEADVLPTVAGIAGVPYANSTLGRDLLDTRFDGNRYAFTAPGSGAYIGLVSDAFCFEMNTDGTAKGLYELYSDTPRENVIDSFPDVVAALEPLCRGMYETAHYMRYHNTPEMVTYRANAAEYTQGKSDELRRE